MPFDSGGLLPNLAEANVEVPKKVAPVQPTMRTPTGNVIPQPIEPGHSTPVKSAGLLPNPTPQPPAPSLAPGTNSQNLVKSVASAPAPYQKPLDAAGGYANQISQQGPRPTDATFPDAQKHHGFHKALDYILPTIFGLTGNVDGALGLHRMMADGPLRHSQEKWDAQNQNLEGGYKRQVELSKGEDSEAKAQAATERADTAEKQAAENARKDSANEDLRRKAEADHYQSQIDSLQQKIQAAQQHSQDTMATAEMRLQAAQEAHAMQLQMKQMQIEMQRAL
ncbi:MAG: hypothetical protein M3O09_15930, partial [Acidobacteriota bacterium]|nr:hypothetical protein [Acidobacteriota bacterium]